MSKPTAVRMYMPVVAPKTRFCPDCYGVLEYWKTAAGYGWFCLNCNKKIEVDENTNK